MAREKMQARPHSQKARTARTHAQDNEYHAVAPDAHCRRLQSAVIAKKKHSKRSTKTREKTTSREVAGAALSRSLLAIYVELTAMLLPCVTLRFPLFDASASSDRNRHRQQASDHLIFISFLKSIHSAPIKMLPSLSHPALPSYSHHWVNRDIQAGLLSDPNSSYISMTDLLTAQHQPYPDSAKLLQNVNESRDGDSEWADFLGCVESLEYVSPDIEQCLAEHRAYEVDQELDLIGNEFLHSPPILSTLAVPEPDTTTPEKFLPNSPTRPVRAQSSFSQRKHPQRSGLRDITSTLSNKPQTPARTNSGGARSLRPLTTVKKEQVQLYSSPPSVLLLREATAEDSKENLRLGSSDSKRASYGKEKKARKTRITRPGRCSLDTPVRPYSANAAQRRCHTARKSKDCLIPGCLKGARSKGLCKRHGGGKRCTHVNCSRSDQGGGFCIAHGGGKEMSLPAGKRCAYEDCKNSAQSRGLCKSHGVRPRLAPKQKSGSPPKCWVSTDCDEFHLLPGSQHCAKSERKQQKQQERENAAMAQDSQVECARGVVLQEARDGGELKHTTLASTLQLKKEIGNARLVSGDAMLWVGEAKLTQKDVDIGGKSAREFRLEKGARSFVFTLETTDTSKQFVDELKEQIDGKLGLEIKRKKRKIRKQMSQAMGFVPVNMLKSPMKTKPPSTPTKLPSSATKSPRLAKPLEVSVATVPDAYQSYPSPSPSKSPFRSPFRKKPAPRQSNLPLSPSLTDPRIASSPRVREWLSPVGSLKMKVELTPPEIRRQSLGTPGSGGSTTDGRAGSPSTRITNKRVRSLQGLLDDVPKDTQPLFTPPKPKPELTPPKQKPELTPPKQNIVSHYFAKKALKRESPSVIEAQSEKPKLSPVKPNLLNQSKQDESQGESTSRESTQEIEPSDQVSTPPFPKRNIRGLLNLGNYCYMNSIVQAVSKLPDFVAGVQNEEWLHKLIRKKLGNDANSANFKTLEEVKAIIDVWKDRDESKTLMLHSALEEVIKKIMTGCDSPINPEPIKQIMGRKNAIFATHFQQDAHEFLLNLVNEYEKELLGAVKSAVEKVTEEAAVEAPAAPKRSSLLNFFRSEPKQGGESKQDMSAAAEEDDLVDELLPAKCFRAELYRTLTCTACEYSRKQVERFYDFSLDLPFNPVRHTEDVVREKASKRQCFCEVDAAVRNTITERIYHCAKAACSYQEKVPTEIVPEPAPSEQQLQDDSNTSAAIGDQVGFPIASAPPSHPTISLDSLMRKQFEPETLELSCEKCKTGKEAVAAYAVKSLPPVIVLHLKRFEVDFKTGKLYKRCDMVEAPASLKPRRTIVGEAESEDDQSYELMSIVHHLGRSIDEGHYVADVREYDGTWVRRNDMHESVISEDYALRASRSQESCYMFFYVRSDTLVENTDKENLPMALAAAAAAEDAENRPLPQLKTPVKKRSGDGAFL